MPGDTRGSAALEFALLGSFMVLLALGAYDLGTAIQQTLRLQAAAGAGAQYAMDHATDQAGTAAVVRANLSGWTNVTVSTPPPSCRCDDGSAISCTGTGCASGTGVPILYVTVSVTRPFTATCPLTLTLFASLATLHGNAAIRLH